jgi:hypothetical protein
MMKKNIAVALALLATGVMLLMSQKTFELVKSEDLNQITLFPLNLPWLNNLQTTSPLPLPTSHLSPSNEAPIAASDLTHNNGTPISEAWVIFQQYLEFAQLHDLPEVRRLSHQMSATCNDTLKEQECFALMDSVHAIGKTLIASDFKYTQADRRQTILYTDGPVVAIIYFTRNESNLLKVLGLRFCFEDNTTVNSCVETDPNRRDLDQNGWWDSVESLFH